MGSGLFIDQTRYETEVPYARSVEDLEFVRQISAAAEDRDLFRSMALWGLPLALPVCSAGIQLLFDPRHEAPVYESLAELKRRHVTGL